MKSQIFNCFLAMSLLCMLFTGCAKDIKAENAEVSATEAVTETETLSETTVKATETTVQPTTTTETASETIQPTIKEEAPVVSAEEPQPDTTPEGEQQQSVQDGPHVIIDGVDIYSGESYSDGGSSYSEEEQAYDPVLHELGIDIVLTGTPAEQCQQYGEALSSVFPGHINYGEHSAGPICDMNKAIEYTNLPDGGKSLYD